jgi:hypothetical protein
MERPSEEFRLSTSASIGIAAVCCAVAALFWNAAGQAEGYPFLGSVILALGCLLLAGLSLWFARNRFVYWLGVITVLVVAAWKG